MPHKVAIDACRVLVADDDTGIREALAELLGDEGFRVTVARNGQEALELCRSVTPPDLVLLDMQMPVMDGLGFLRVRDADPQLSRIPVCLMTALPGPLGVPNTVSVILRKPIGLPDVVAVANRFCATRSTKELSRTDRQADAAAQASDPPAARSA